MKFNELNAQGQVWLPEPFGTLQAPCDMEEVMDFPRCVVHLEPVVNDSSSDAKVLENGSHNQLSQQ